MNTPVKDKLSNSALTMLLFDMTMSYVMSIRDTPMKWKVRQIFNEFNEVGTNLWTTMINQLKKDNKEHSFDLYNEQLNEVIRHYLNSTDPVTLIAMMDAFNKGEIEIKSDHPTDPNEMIIHRQIVEHQRRSLHQAEVNN